MQLIHRCGCLEGQLQGRIRYQRRDTHHRSAGVTYQGRARCARGMVVGHQGVSMAAIKIFMAAAVCLRRRHGSHRWICCCSTSQDTTLFMSASTCSLRRCPWCALTRRMALTPLPASLAVLARYHARHWLRLHQQDSCRQSARQSIRRRMALMRGCRSSTALSQSVLQP